MKHLVNIFMLNLSRFTKKIYENINYSKNILDCASNNNVTEIVIERSKNDLLLITERIEKQKQEFSISSELKRSPNLLELKILSTYNSWYGFYTENIGCFKICKHQGDRKQISNQRLLNFSLLYTAVKYRKWFPKVIVSNVIYQHFFVEPLVPFFIKHYQRFPTYTNSLKNLEMSIICLNQKINVCFRPRLTSKYTPIFGCYYLGNYI